MDAGIASTFPGSDARERVQAALASYGCTLDTLPIEWKCGDSLTWVVTGALARRYGIPYGEYPGRTRTWLVAVTPAFSRDVLTPAVEQATHALWAYSLTQANALCWEVLPPLGAEQWMQVTLRPRSRRAKRA